MTEPTGFHPARRHVPALDGVRGLAILAVMAFHFTLRMPDGTAGDRLVHRVLGAGWAGVDLFFVLSGLLITTLLLDAKGAPYYYRTFSGRRALRIFPLYYGFLAVYFLFVVRTGTTGNDHYPCGAIIVGAPIFRLWLRAHHAALIAPYALTPARLDSLAVGALLAIVLADRRVSPVGSRVFIGLGAMAAAITVAVFHTHRGLWTYGGWEEGPGYTIMAIGWGGLVAAGATAARGTIPARVLGARWLRALGKYSYAMYVFHVPIWAHVQPLVFPGNRVPTLFGSHIPASLALGVLCGVLAFAAAFVSWNLYEKQFLKLKRYFAYAPRVRGSGARDASESDERSPAAAGTAVAGAG